ncbi:MAG: cysteine-rich KTR domain-containing protein [Faecousia sp.]
MNGNQENSRWIHCSIYNGKTRTKVYADMVMFQYPLYCPKCKRNPN